MSTFNKLVLGLSAVAISGIMVLIARRYRTGKMLSEVSNEGYETAHDVLYPLKKGRFNKLHFGPVLPI